MKRLFLILVMGLLAMPIHAAPPYDVTVTYSPPLTGGPPDGYNLYLDDCVVSGPVAAPVGLVTSGQEFPALILADGTYQLCVRAFNAEGEQVDPGAVVPLDTLMSLIPGALESLTINIILQGVNVQITCDSTGCVTTTN